uniref:Variant surface glycoprotein 1125.75 n=1 Tax=Trypanosoma brucei TaxID=5691 RepID=A0A1J0R463_9TRYP|nr:variant surface glycoprotein 1125.75 [Trypanosoma brucei]
MITTIARLTLAFMLAPTLTTATPDKTNTIAFESDNWCTEKKFLSNTITAIRSVVLAAFRSEVENRKQLCAWKLAAAGSDNVKEQKAYELLSAVGHKAAMQSMDKTLETSAAADKATAVLGARIGYLERVQGVVMAHPAEITKSETRSGSADSAPCQIKIKPAKTTVGGCKHTAEKAATAEQLQEMLKTATHVKLFDELGAEKHLEEGILNFNLGASATWADANEGGGQVCKTNSVGQTSFKLQAGKGPAAKVRTPAAKNHKLDDPSNKDATAAEGEYPATETAGKQIAKVLHDLQVALNKPELDLTTLTIEALKRDSQIAELARNLLSDNPGIDQITVESKGETLSKLLSRYFGEDGAAYNKRFLKELRSSELTVKLGDKAEAKPISFLCQPENFAKAVTYLQGQSLKKQAEKSIVTISKTSEPICNHKKKDECSKDDKCKWEGTEDKGTCKPKDEKEGVKLENDGKTTNTTGSNSFLIKASPLWLAFLLL